MSQTTRAATPDATALFKSAEQQSFPSCTQVTLVHGICDSGCVACPVGRLTRGDATPEIEAEFPLETRDFMESAIFRRVAEEVARHPSAWLRLHARGEPLLHPELVPLIRHAKQAGVRLIQAFTNAIALDRGMAVGLLDAGLDVLECSIHGHERTYEALMRNQRFEQVRANVIGFRELRDARGGPTKLVVSAVDQPAFQVEKEAHRAFWSEIADEVIYRPFHSWGNRVDAPCGSVPRGRTPCAQLWTRCTVGPTGKVLACFNSWSERDEEVLGDLTDPGQTIRSIWTSARYAALRQDHLEGRFESLPCCASCEDWRGSAWGSNSYEGLLGARLKLGGGDGC